MNYRHGFHAGNFADLVKHAGLIQILQGLVRDPASLAVFDTHAGRGRYDLSGDQAQRSGEARAGIERLMGMDDLPNALSALRLAVRSLNPNGGITAYPGSPWLIAQALRPGDSYLACELQPGEHQALSRNLAAYAGARAICADGFTAVAEAIPPAGRVLILVDPPFERGDDYLRMAGFAKVAQARNPAAVLVFWLPLKDLETFDAFLRALEPQADGGFLVAEARLRPLSDPMRMNGCALVVGGAPEVSPALEQICRWVVQSLGEGGQSRVWTLG